MYVFKVEISTYTFDRRNLTPSTTHDRRTTMEVDFLKKENEVKCMFKRPDICSPLCLS
jgi:hypothetical protein